MSNTKFETITVTAPACWASYLFNGDASGIDDSDVEAADAMLAHIGLGWPVDCSEESAFRAYPDYTTRGESGQRLAADCLTYSFLRKIEPEGEIAEAMAHFKTQA